MGLQQRRTRPIATDRSQTGIDFVVGMGIFLLTVGFVVGFVPGMLTPFGDETGTPLLADRIADELVGDALAASPGSASLDEECTIAFFGAGSPTGCPFEGDGPATDWLALPDGAHLNVTVERDVAGPAPRETLCASVGDSTDGNVTTCEDGNTRLAYGLAVPGVGASVTTATRLVALDGEAVVVVVRLW